MANIKIIMKDGAVKEFRHEGRAGGSYTKRLTIEGAFAVVTDEWYKKIFIPANDIARIEETPER